MLFENPLIAELHLIYKALKGIKEDLLALENKSIFEEDKERRIKLILHLRFLLGHVKHYSKKELELFARDDLSKSCAKLLNDIGSGYFLELDEMFYRQRIPKKFPFEQLRELIQKIEEAERITIKAEDEVKFELRQKRKARRLAHSVINVREVGCYHYAPIGRILHIMRNGIISLEYAKTELQQELEITLENYQGSNYLSVFDSYSYWKLYRYFLAKKSLGRIMKGHLTEEDLKGAFKANKDLNFSKFAEINISMLRAIGAFDGPDSMYITSFKNTMIEIANGRLGKYPFFGVMGDLVLVIRDTAEFFPEHDNAYAFEARFRDKIGPDKIVGIILTERSEGYSPLIREFVKFIGIPLYNENGKLVWPRE